MERIPIWEKEVLTLDEASAYSNIGVNTLRKISNGNCPFVLWIGTKRLIKRKAFEKYLQESFLIDT